MTRKSQPNYIWIISALLMVVVLLGIGYLLRSFHGSSEELAEDAEHASQSQQDSSHTISSDSISTSSPDSAAMSFEVLSPRDSSLAESSDRTAESDAEAESAGDGDGIAALRAVVKKSRTADLGKDIRSTGQAPADRADAVDDPAANHIVTHERLIEKVIPDSLMVTLRDTTVALSEAQVSRIINEKDYFDANYNPDGKGIENRFEERRVAGEILIVDRVTGLMWQQKGSDESLAYENATDYVRKLNEQSFAGYSDWRLPTLEEALSLLKPRENKGEVFVDVTFSRAQNFIWTADRLANAGTFAKYWHVSFAVGKCGTTTADYDNYVRAVRTIRPVNLP